MTLLTSAQQLALERLEHSCRTDCPQWCPPPNHEDISTLTTAVRYLDRTLNSLLERPCPSDYSSIASENRCLRERVVELTSRLSSIDKIARGESV